MDDGISAGSQRDVVNVRGAEDGGAPAQGGSSSSTSGGEPSTETSACEQPMEGGEPRRKKRRVGDSGSDEEYEVSEIADAINKFTEAYVKIETTKIESRKTAIDHETSMATMTMEMEERRYKSMLETQLAVAKLIAEAVKGTLDRCLDIRDLRDS